MNRTPTQSAIRLLAEPGSSVDGAEHVAADLTFGGCRDPLCPTGEVEPTVDMA